MKKIINWLFPHKHRYERYVASRYCSFNWRDVICECKCGERWKEKDKPAEWILPYLETCDPFEKFEEYLTNGKYHINSESHNEL